MNKMADINSVLGSISRKFLECPICHGRYQQPKVLNCLHTFCQACLVTLHDYASGQGSFVNSSSIQCPVCNQKSELPKGGVPKLKTNFYLVSLLEEITAQERAAQVSKMEICGSCEKEEEAVSRCIDCSMDLCLNCQTVPRHIAAVLAQHTVASLEELGCGKIADGVRKQRGIPECPKHPGNKKVLFCETCQDLICKECSGIHERKDTGNTSHLILDLESAASNRRKSTEEELAKIQITVSDFKSSLDNIETRSQKFDDNLDSVREHIQKVSSKIRNEVSFEEEQLIFQISQISKEQRKKLSDRHKNTESSIEQMVQTMEAADAICKTSEDCDFLAVYPLIKKALESHSRKKPYDNTLPIWKFKVKKAWFRMGSIVKESETQDSLQESSPAFRQPENLGKHEHSWNIGAQRSMAGFGKTNLNVNKKSSSVGRTPTTQTTGYNFGQAASGTSTTTATSCSGFAFKINDTTTTSSCQLAWPESSTVSKSSGFSFRQSATANSAKIITRSSGEFSFGQAVPVHNTFTTLGFGTGQTASGTSTTMAPSASGFSFGHASTQSARRFSFGSFTHPSTVLKNRQTTTTGTSGFSFERAPFATNNAITQSARGLGFGQSASFAHPTTTICTSGFGTVQAKSRTNTATTTCTSGFSFGHAPSAASNVNTQSAGGFSSEESVFFTHQNPATSASEFGFGQAPSRTNTTTPTIQNGFRFGLSAPVANQYTTTSTLGLCFVAATSRTNTTTPTCTPGFSSGHAPLTTSKPTTSSFRELSFGQPVPATSTTEAVGTSTTRETSALELGLGHQSLATSKATTKAFGGLSHTITVTATSGSGFKQITSETITNTASCNSVFCFGQPLLSTSKATTQSFGGSFCGQPAHATNTTTTATGLGSEELMSKTKSTTATFTLGLGFDRQPLATNSFGQSSSVTSTTAALPSESGFVKTASKTSSTLAMSGSSMGQEQLATNKSTTPFEGFSFEQTAPVTKTTSVTSTLEFDFQKPTPGNGTTAATGSSGFCFGQPPPPTNKATTTSFKGCSFDKSLPVSNTTTASATFGFGSRQTTSGTAATTSGFFGGQLPLATSNTTTKYFGGTSFGRSAHVTNRSTSTSEFGLNLTKATPTSGCSFGLPAPEISTFKSASTCTSGNDLGQSSLGTRTTTTVSASCNSSITTLSSESFSGQPASNAPLTITKGIGFGLRQNPSSKVTMQPSGEVSFGQSVPRTSSTPAIFSGLNFGVSAPGTSSSDAQSASGFNVNLSTFGTSSNTSQSSGSAFKQSTSGTNDLTTVWSLQPRNTSNAFGGARPKTTAQVATLTTPYSLGFVSKKRAPDLESHCPLVFKPFKPATCSTTTVQKAAEGTSATYLGFSSTPLATYTTEIKPVLDKKSGEKADNQATKSCESNISKAFSEVLRLDKKLKAEENIARIKTDSSSKKEDAAVGGKDDSTSEEEDDTQFETVTHLPKQDTKCTGEEDDENKLFCSRAKLYHYDSAISQWKDRGIGDIKILHNIKTQKYRIMMMRSDQVFRVCANHYITKEMRLAPNAGSDNSLVWQAMDVSDGNPRMEELAVRFKLTETTQRFKAIFEECQADFNIKDL